MSSSSGKYNIKAVSKMLGIQAGTLRAWERRYKMIRPNRNEAGHRLYTDEHIKIIKWLLDKVNQGFTISQAVSLLESANDTNATNEAGKDESQYEQLIEDILSALFSFDERKATELLDYAFSIFSIDNVAIEVLSPLLVRVGEWWEQGKITSSHEHFASNFIRTRLGMLLFSTPSVKIKPKVVCVCGPNEQHELGLLIFSLFLKRQGYDVIYLGQSVAEGDIDKIIEEINPQILFISCTMRKNIPTSIHLADALKQTFEDLKIGLGGFALDQLEIKDLDEINPNYLVGDTREKWAEWLSINGK